MGKRRESLLSLVEFVMCLLGGEMLVDFWLAQNPLLPTTDAKFSVREILKFAISNFKVANFKICFPSFLQIFPFSPVISFSTFPKKFLWK